MGRIVRFVFAFVFVFVFVSVFVFFVFFLFFLVFCCFSLLLIFSLFLQDEYSSEYETDDSCYDEEGDDEDDLLSAPENEEPLENEEEDDDYDSDEGEELTEDQREIKYFHKEFDELILWLHRALDQHNKKQVWKKKRKTKKAHLHHSDSFSPGEEIG